MELQVSPFQRILTCFLPHPVCGDMLSINDRVLTENHVFSHHYQAAMGHVK